MSRRSSSLAATLLLGNLGLALAAGAYWCGARTGRPEVAASPPRATEGASWSSPEAGSAPRAEVVASPRGKTAPPFQDPMTPRSRRGGIGRRGFPGRFDEPRTPFVPAWTIEPEFSQDVFTFARVEYTSAPRPGGGRRFYEWWTDWPDADNNFSYRLNELTSLRVNPQPVVVRFDQPEIFQYPFVYLVEAGNMALTEAEVAGLRQYLLRGGFLMVDDFWGEWAYEGLIENLQRVFPDRQPQELPLEHEVFHMVYNITAKPIIPSVHHYQRGMLTETYDATEAHYQGLFDDQGRMMVIICHNTDLGDGWEREGVDEGYFKMYSEPWAYPIGINIVTYAMTH